jgi:phage-related protein
MAVFDWAETDATNVDVQARIRTAQFGDGYQQRSPDGLNPVVQTWSLSFDDCDNDVATTLIAFLRANIGLAFDWTPKWGTTPIKVTCGQWSRAIASEYSCNIRAEFKQVFEP